LVFSDVASLKHAQRAAETGVDGLILLCGGSGGNTGWLNPFAFVTAVRKFFSGPVVLAGAISNGRLIHVAEELGADFAYVGTPFIAATESMAADDYRQMLIESNADDIQLTAEVTGIPDLVAGGKRRKQSLLLLGSAVFRNDMSCAKIVNVDDRSDPAVGGGKFLDGETIGEKARCRAAVFLGDGHAHETLGAENSQLLGRSRRGAITLGCSWGKDIPSELSGGVADHSLLVG
jgi:hypothetical protein